MSQTDTGLKMPKDKKILLLLALVFVLPFTMALALHLLDIRPGGKSFGELVTPPVELTIPAFTNADGNVFSKEKWTKVWNVVMINQANCDAICEQSIDKIDRVQRTLHKDKDRVQQIVILKGAVNQERIKQLESKFAGLVVLSVQEDAQQAFADQFTDIAPEGSIYLVDPLYNLMMHYPSNIEPKALRADVKKLLKNSWGG